VQVRNQVDRLKTSRENLTKLAKRQTLTVANLCSDEPFYRILDEDETRL
jgi:hypothetical protein